MAKNSLKIVNKKTSIKKEELTFDISSMNLIDACKTSVLLSTQEFLRNPDAHINWIVSSSQVKDMVSSLMLDNSSFIYE